MGCFSFLCQGCKQPIKSSSFRGERCNLFLLLNGKIIERMSGEYDSYGRVFDENGESVHWALDWSDVCDLMFSKYTSSGISAYHEDCYKKIAPTQPVVRSLNDPDQGWGEFKLPEPPFKSP